MKIFFKNLFNSSILILSFAILLSGIYPVFIFLFSKIAFNHESNGSLIKIDNKIIGSKLLGQKFTSDIYFNSRPSINGYLGINNTSSNLSQTSKEFFIAVEKNSDEFRKKNMVSLDQFLPNDAVTYSASGLDPHITYMNASFQKKRVAKIRNTTEDNIQKLIDENIEKHVLFSTLKVNVLLLNLELDKKFPIKNKNR